MSETQTTKPPIWYWSIAGIALIWNALGVMAYLMQVTMNDQAMAALPPAHQELYAAMPMWVTAAFAIAVFAGLAGSIALLLKKAIAFMVFGLSLLAILAQQIYMFFMSNTFEVMGDGAKIMPYMILIFGIFLVWFARLAKQKGWTS